MKSTLGPSCPTAQLSHGVLADPKLSDKTQAMIMMMMAYIDMCKPSRGVAWMYGNHGEGGMERSH